MAFPGLGMFGPVMNTTMPMPLPQPQQPKGLGFMDHLNAPQMQLAMQLLAASGPQMGDPTFGARLGQAGLGFVNQQERQRNIKTRDEYMRTQMDEMRKQSERADKAETRLQGAQDYQVAVDTAERLGLGQALQLWNKGDRAGAMTMAAAGGQDALDALLNVAKTEQGKFTMNKYGVLDTQSGDVTPHSAAVLGSVAGMGASTALITRRGKIADYMRVHGIDEATATKLVDDELKTVPNPLGGVSQLDQVTGTARDVRINAAPAPKMPGSLGEAFNMPPSATPKLTGFEAIEKGTGLESAAKELWNTTIGLIEGTKGAMYTDVSAARTTLSAMGKLIEQGMANNPNRVSVYEMERLKGIFDIEPNTFNPQESVTERMRVAHDILTGQMLPESWHKMHDPNLPQELRKEATEDFYFMLRVKDALGKPPEKQGLGGGLNVMGATPIPGT